MSEHPSDQEDFDSKFTAVGRAGRKPSVRELTEDDPFALPEDAPSAQESFDSKFTEVGTGGFDPNNLPQADSRELMRRSLLRGARGIQRFTMETKSIPSLIDQSAIMADLIDWVDNEGSFAPILSRLLTTPAAILTQPEFMAMYVDLWDENLVHLVEEQGFEPSYAELQRSLAWGNIGNITEALYANVNPDDIDPALAFEAGPNVSGFFDRVGKHFNAEQQELMWAFFAAAPTEQFQTDTFKRGLGPTSAAGFMAMFDTFGAGGDVVQEALPRNVREELAIEAINWVEGKGAVPFNSEIDKKDFILWMWMTLEEKTGEIKSRDSGLGVLGGIIDLPKEAVTAGINKLITEIWAPDDGLNWTSLSLGQNAAIMMDFMPGDAAGSSFFNHPIAKTITRPLRYAINAVPVVAAWTAYRVATFDEEGLQRRIDLETDPKERNKLQATLDKGESGQIVGTPLLGSVIESFESANSYEFVSGGIDFMSWIVLDPINYFAAAGFGLKFARSVPRAANISRGRYMLQLLVPFSGGYTGVSGGITTKVTAAMFSKTVNELVSAASKSHKGRQVYKLALAAENGEQFANQVVGVNPRLGQFLVDTAKTQQGPDFFWETVRGTMSGWNDAGNPGTMDVLMGMLNGMDRNLVHAAKARLKDGSLGIRQIARGVFGSTTDEVFEVVLRSGAFDEGVTERIKLLDKGLAKSAIIDVVVLEDGAEMVIKVGAPGTVGGYIDGVFVGGIEGAKPSGLITASGQEIGSAASAAVLPKYRERGIYSALADAVGDEGKAALKGASQQSESFRITQGSQSSVYRASEGAEDGKTKLVINTKLGWKEMNIGNQRQLDQLLKYLTENGQVDLAAKIQHLNIPGIREAGISSLTDAERIILRRWLDNLSEYDVLRLDDEIMFARRAEPKLISGPDVAAKTSIENVLKDELYDSSIAFATRKQIGAKRHDMMLTARMPTPANTAIFRRNIANFVGLNSRNRVAEFARRFRATLKSPIPDAVHFGKIGEGGASLRTFMRMMGLNAQDVEKGMGPWWKADSIEGRRQAFLQAVQLMGDKLDNPHLRFGLSEFWKRHGEHMFHQTLGGTEIGAASKVDGVQRIVPFTKSMMTDSVVLPNIHQMQQTQRRYRFGSKHPNLIAGFGQTRKNRLELSETIISHIRSQYGPKVLEGLDPDDIMAMAYADVLGFQGRENGLGLVNKMYQNVSRGYNMFHTTFTYGQLAFRPFAWSSRINMEEHMRGWLMGVPTLIRHPSQYITSLWDTHFWKTRPAQYKKQQLALNRSVASMFAGDLEDTLRQADEILPGFSGRMKKRNIIAEDSVRTAWITEMSKSLFGAADAKPFGSRGNIARRVMLRQQRLKVHNSRLREKFLIGDDLNILDDVPELQNKFNVWTFQDELTSSVQRLDFTSQTRVRDIPAYGHAWLKKTHQIVNDEGGRYALNRMRETLNGDRVPRFTAERFVRREYWQAVRDNVEDIARYRNASFETEEELAEWYLDTIMRDDLIGSHFGGLWGQNLAERTRMINELADGKALTGKIGDRKFSLGLADNDYADSKGAAGKVFMNQREVGNFQFPNVGGFFSSQMGNNSNKNWGRKAADWMMHTFGEEVSQTLHRRPSYMHERRRWVGILKGLGWNDADVAAYAHEEAFTMVNWIFFNNQHVGATVHRMNKVVPFFSAWAEVMGTWAWKIPTANFAPVGYINMIHKMDRMAQGLVDLGLVEISDTGQWYLALDDDPRSTVPLGNALSKVGYDMIQAPVTIAEQIANTARWAITELGDEDFNKPADFSAWKADNYQLAIGSPIRINSHGMLGVNQFQFGFSPPVNFGASQAMKLMPYAGDTKLIEGATLEEMFDNLPTDIGTAEFIALNERQLTEAMGGRDQYNLLFQGSGFNPDLSNVDTSGLSLQVPRSSWLDGVIDDTFFPFGHVDTPAGIIREIVPGSLSYILRGAIGVHADQVPFAEGILTAITGPTEQYQIDAAVNREILLLEVDEGLITQASNLSVRISEIVSKDGFETIEEYVRSAEPGTPTAIQFTRLNEALSDLNDEIMKRATDRAMHGLWARGLMGFFSPATPRMFMDEMQVTAAWYNAREIAEAASVRGSLDFSSTLNDVDISSTEDLDRFLGIVNQWYLDPNGSQVKAWFMDLYPGLLAFTQPITYYGPAGAPPAQRDLDNFFDDLKSGRRATLPEDVIIQKVARTAVIASREGDIIKTVGSNDPWEQAQWFLTNAPEGTELRDTYRFKLKALDMWDDELNNGAFLEWRERNEKDHPTRFEALEEEFYIMQDLFDDIVVLTKLSDLEDEDQKTVMTQLGIVMRNFGESYRRLRDEITTESDYLVPREEIIAQYYLDINEPYYLARQDLFDQFDLSETRESRSVIWEDIRDLENESFLKKHLVTWGGQSITVPGPIERAWSFKSPEEMADQVLEWIGRRPEWLSLHATSKMVEAFPGVEPFLATTREQSELYAEATELKNNAIRAAREDPSQITRYERDQFIAKVDGWLLQELGNAGRSAEAEWIEAWPIERLRMSGQLPASMEDMADWYHSIRQDLESREKPLGPGSEIGRRQFLALAAHLENVYFKQNPSTREDIDRLGQVMFGEQARFAIYKRFYGQFKGELD